MPLPKHTKESTNVAIWAQLLHLLKFSGSSTVIALSQCVNVMHAFRYCTAHAVFVFYVSYRFSSPPAHLFLQCHLIFSNASKVAAESLLKGVDVLQLWLCIIWHLLTALHLHNGTQQDNTNMSHINLKEKSGVHQSIALCSLLKVTEISDLK